MPLCCPSLLPCARDGGWRERRVSGQALFSDFSRSICALSFHGWLAVLFVLVCVPFGTVVGGETPTFGNQNTSAKPPAAPTRSSVALPGLVVNFNQRCVDIAATICLDQGMLELIACTKGSKEHESIVAVTAKPMHIHTALLLLGANSGAPAVSKCVDDQSNRWVQYPPRGDPVDVYLVFKNKDGQMVEHPVSDFVVRADQSTKGLATDNATDRTGNADGDDKFPKTFLFAGSRLRDNGPGPRTYLADRSGNVISIATFGDELLCLPGTHASANDALLWQVDASALPKVGSNITLRLRPQRKPAAVADAAKKHQRTRKTEQHIK